MVRFSKLAHTYFLARYNTIYVRTVVLEDELIKRQSRLHDAYLKVENAYRYAENELMYQQLDLDRYFFNPPSTHVLPRDDVEKRLGKLDSLLSDYNDCDTRMKWESVAVKIMFEEVGRAKQEFLYTAGLSRETPGWLVKAFDGRVDRNAERERGRLISLERTRYFGRYRGVLELKEAIADLKKRAQLKFEETDELEETD
ncbi:hypothetical protein MAPG_08475 [Magnaporthiopsis poae ATCC 64411]|uniref:Uncharacterized protein n=1 Tax=Magnaporthiopsis poae (strain ATCC 64411 / 73-15) TaxID=644358 RepID=A0A0C4E7G2_MAGP6|nr:hypothetical protein MAPG_08475 [Magnaporthiopsis poae ATCC 64411]